MAKVKKPLSLRAQALALLAQRDYSVRELRAKLLRRLQARAAAQARASAEASADAGVAGESGESAPDHETEVDDVIAWLLQQRYLDEDRFIASRVNVRSARFGLSRITQELSRHGLELPAETSQELRSSELLRARAIWQRRFGQPPADLREAARQARFLAGRGFSGDVIRQVLRAGEQAADDDLEVR